MRVNMNQDKIANKLAREMLSNLRLTPKDKKVIEAFIRKKSGESNNLTSDRWTLDGNWMGGREIAIWNDDEKIEFMDLGSRAAQVVQRAIAKNVPRSWLANP